MDLCIYCKSEKIVKNGKTKLGDQEYYCRKCRSYLTLASNPAYPRSRFDAETMCLTVLWYFRFNLSLGNLAEIMLSRGIDVSHQTISRWIKKLGPDIGIEARSHWNHRRTISWYVDETYIKVKGEWKYLYRAVDKNGETLDVMLSPNRNKKEARKFLRKTLKSFKEKPKRVYTDKNQAYAKPIKGTLKAKHGIMHITVTPIERTHVPVKRRYHSMTGFMNFENAYHFTENFEYIRGYLGGTNVLNRKERIKVWEKIEILVNKKAS